MHYETINTQMKVAQLLHEMDGCQPSPFEQCGHRQDHVVKSAGFLGKLMPTIVMEMIPQVRKDEREKIAYHIRAELVCCDLYERVGSATPEQFGMTEDAWDKLSVKSVANLMGLGYHAICHWGGYAAALAEQGPERGDSNADPRSEHGCTFDCSICHQDCQEWGCGEHGPAATS